MTKETQPDRDRLAVVRILEKGPRNTAQLWKTLGKRYHARRTRTALNHLMDTLEAAGVVTRSGGTKGHGRAIVWELAKGGEA